MIGCENYIILYGILFRDDLSGCFFGRTAIYHMKIIEAPCKLKCTWMILNNDSMF